ncbi:MAG TPA: hypothetical protein VKB19_17640, partial [Pedobacter sp.]|nr:hypothetical protein [Pedobacter sp.]
MSVKIRTVAKILPQYSRKTAEIIPYLDHWLAGEDERFIRKVKKIFENAGVDERYSIMSPEQVFAATSFEERNDIYSSEGITLAAECLKLGLKKAGWDTQDLDYIITVSCTGIMIPSLDAYLINSLGLR